MQIAKCKITWKFYTPLKALSTTKWVQIISQKKVAVKVLDLKLSFYNLHNFFQSKTKDIDISGLRRPDNFVNRGKSQYFEKNIGLC